MTIGKKTDKKHKSCKRCGWKCEDAKNLQAQQCMPCMPVCRSKSKAKSTQLT